MSPLVLSKTGVWCKSRLYYCHISSHLVKTTLGILDQQIRQTKYEFLLSGRSFLVNIRLLVASFQTQSGHLVGVVPAGRTVDLLGRCICTVFFVGFITSIMHCTAAHHFFLVVTPGYGLIQDAHHNLFDRSRLTTSSCQSQPGP